jgi:hypothetical protein
MRFQDCHQARDKTVRLQVGQGPEGQNDGLNKMGATKTRHEAGFSIIS